MGNICGGPNKGKPSQMLVKNSTFKNRQHNGEMHE
jgi:hypothetical protein